MLNLRVIRSRIKNNHVESLVSKNQLDRINPLRLYRIHIFKEWSFDKLLSIVKVIVEYAFGMHIGYAVGWAIGLYAGYVYVEFFEPVYLDDLSELSYWRLSPFVFARNGTFLGLAIGIIVIAVMNARSHRECKRDEHAGHLCRFVSYGYHVNNEEDYKNLVKEPRYKCCSCGRTANIEQNLCRPRKL
ncbi:MAG: hypothetical protein JW837_06325 [Sedimentisphaerales bacterium]|nr:hypothetical protein [Sedimentisphaerales bacterium]